MKICLECEVSGTKGKESVELELDEESALQVVKKFWKKGLGVNSYPVV
jgi:hypothetical protein